MQEQNNEKFNLEAPAINNYVNLILQDMKNYQWYSENRYKTKHLDALSALMRLLRDMPPKGKEYMIEQFPDLTGFDVEKIYQILDKYPKEEIHSDLDAVFNAAMDWLWPNILELNFNMVKPRVKEVAKIGVPT